MTRVKSHVSRMWDAIDWTAWLTDSRGRRGGNAAPSQSGIFPLRSQRVEIIWPRELSISISTCESWVMLMEKTEYTSPCLQIQLPYTCTVLLYNSGDHGSTGQCKLLFFFFFFSIFFPFHSQFVVMFDSLRKPAQYLAAGYKHKVKSRKKRVRKKETNLQKRCLASAGDRLSAGALAWGEVVGVGAHVTAEARGVESAAFGNDVAWPERRAARAGAAVEAVRIPIGCCSGLLRVQKNRSA